MSETTHDDHLMASEQFQIGGRDTVVLVWLLAAFATIGFMLLAP